MKIEIDHEENGRWIVEVPDLPGVMAYGASQEQAVSRAKALALRVIADRLDHGEPVPELNELFAIPARAGGLPRRHGASSPLFSGSGGL